MAKPIFIFLKTPPPSARIASGLADLLVRQLGIKPTSSFTSNAAGRTTKPKPVTLDAIEDLAHGALDRGVNLFVTLEPLELLVDSSDTLRLEVVAAKFVDDAFRARLVACLREASTPLGLRFDSCCVLGMSTPRDPTLAAAISSASVQLAS